MPRYPTAHPVRRVAVLLLVLLLALAISACEWTDLVDNDDDEDDSDNTPPATETNVPGLSVAVSTRDFDTTLDALIDAINDRGALAPAFSIDHQANAQNENLSLRPTTVVFVDDANRESALIAADVRTALDLPARVLVYRDRDADTGVAFSNAAYLAARYDLDGAEEGTLDVFDDDLEAIATAAANDDLDSTASAAGVAEGEGIVAIDSDDDFATVVGRLNSGLQSRDLTIAQTIDFQNRDVGRGINPAYLAIFGNPAAGTPLLRANQTVGVDLPQKMLVAQADDGGVTVYYNDPAFIAARHDIDNRDDEIGAIDDLLDELAREAAGVALAVDDDDPDNTTDDANAGTGDETGTGNDADAGTDAGTGIGTGAGTDDTAASDTVDAGP
jgi:uncharacterized protein (DUF302 family)